MERLMDVEIDLPFAGELPLRESRAS